MCADESNIKDRIGNPLFLLRVCLSEFSTCDVVYQPLSWNQRVFLSKSDEPSTANLEGLGVPVYEASIAIIRHLEAFRYKPPTGLGRSYEP